ncbi:MAG: NCS2 family permease [Gemmatimonadales bacterium]|nr:NCS2 family permease [Gemmatimonadales bacterium]
MERLFRLAEHGTTVRRELLAGVTTFATMAYIVVVNPVILANAGIPREASLTATALAAAIGTLLMAFHANRPFAIAPYMGENAFIAFTVVQRMGVAWPVALGAVFLAGVLFTLLTLSGVRTWLAGALPRSLKHAFAAGIGLFLVFLGLAGAGLVVPGMPGAPVRLGDLGARPAQLAVGGFVLTAWLLVRRVPGALILGIAATAAASFLLGVTPPPAGLVSAPASLAPILFQLDIPGALTVQALPVVVIVFVMAFVDTLGTLLGLSARAGWLDERGDLPRIEQPMLADAVANLVAPVLGTTTCGAFVESATGIEAGGRTGLVGVVVALLFLATLVLGPVLTAIPPHACAVALVAIGLPMLEPVRHVEFGDLTEAIPALLTVALIALTFNIGVGMTAGLLAYPVLKVGAGRAREVAPAMWALAALSLLFFVVHPRG